MTCMSWIDPSLFILLKELRGGGGGFLSVTIFNQFGSQFETMSKESDIKLTKFDEQADSLNPTYDYRSLPG